MKSKRGVSDVVATILVVLITIAAAAMLISFVLPFIQKNLDSGTECMKYKDYLKFAPELKYTCYESSGLHGFSVRASSLGEETASTEQQNKYHSADYDKNWRISTEERDVFAGLYNYRQDTAEGRIQTGEYHVDASNLSGYSPGPGPQPSGQWHTGDYDKNWRIGSAELSRVVVFSNYRINGVVTGDYRLAESGETSVDGYGVGPAKVSSVGSGNNDVLVGFEVRLSNGDGSVKASVYNDNSTSSSAGGVRVLDRTITTIAVPRNGEVQTFVYNSGGAVYKTLEIYPVLKSGRVCDKTDAIEISTCRGVTLTP